VTESTAGAIVVEVKFCDDDLINQAKENLRQFGLDQISGDFTCLFKH
jgi:hypothetical protein